MKTYEETTRDVLERRDEYDRAKKKRTKTATASISTLTLVAVISAGIVFGSAKRGTDHVKPETEQNTDIEAGGDGTLNTPDSAELPTETIITDSGIENQGGDAIGWLEIEGVYYEQSGAGATDGNVSNLPFLGEYLGHAGDFDGAYRNGIEGVTGEVYRVNWEDADIVVILSNGAFIMLKDNGGTPVVSGSSQLDPDEVYN